MNLPIPIISAVTRPCAALSGLTDGLRFPAAVIRLLIAVFYLKSWRLAALYLASLGLVLSFYLTG